MEIRHLDPESEVTTQFEQMPVPAARPLSDFCMERVGDDVVLYDPENIQYHTLNVIAFDVWRLCDGTRSVEEIAGELLGSGAGVHVDAVALAVAELGESGLLASRETVFEPRFHRRRVLKLAAAGLVVGVAVPLVSSITAPEALAQVSCGGPCSSPNVCCTPTGPCRLQNGAGCSQSSQCCSGCCRSNSNPQNGQNTCVTSGGGNQCYSS